jgi:hypothetical protein
MMGEILQTIIEHCERYTFQDDCRFLGSTARALHTPRDSDVLLATLVERFPANELEATGIVQLDSDGQLVLAPQLSTKEGVLVPLFAAPDKAPYEVVTPAGCLVGRTHPALAGLRDYRTRKLITAVGNRLFAVFTIHDLACWGALSLPAVLASGLTEIRGNQLRSLRQELGWAASGRVVSCQRQRVVGVSI